VSPRPDVSGERKKQILDAALSIFNRQGFDRTRMDDIAREAGLSKGLLYWYFESKQDLLLALLDGVLAEMLQRVEQIDRDHGSATDKLRVLAELSRQMVDKELISVMFNFFLQSLHDEQVQKAFFDLYEEFLTFLAGVIREGMVNGEFRDDLDPNHVAGAIAAAIDGLGIQVMFVSEVDWQARLDETVEIFLTGIRREDTATET
jgi:AcrR family transcriptional regulator